MFNDLKGIAGNVAQLKELVSTLPQTPEFYGRAASALFMKLVITEAHKLAPTQAYVDSMVENGFTAEVAAQLWTFVLDQALTRVED